MNSTLKSADVAPDGDADLDDIKVTGKEATQIDR